MMTARRRKALEKIESARGLLSSVANDFLLGVDHEDNDELYALCYQIERLYTRVGETFQKQHLAWKPKFTST